jgi:hypothetical protein
MADMTSISPYDPSLNRQNARVSDLAQQTRSIVQQDQSAIDQNNKSTKPMVRVQPITHETLSIVRDDQAKIEQTNQSTKPLARTNNLTQETLSITRNDQAKIEQTNQSTKPQARVGTLTDQTQAAVLKLKSAWDSTVEGMASAGAKTKQLAQSSIES